MMHPVRPGLPLVATAIALLVVACAPTAAPSPTAAPAKPAPTAAPAKPAEKPETKAEAKPAEKPAAKPETKPDSLALTDAERKSVEEFYKGKNVKIVVGFSAGGGYDTYARLIAKHLGRHIPGNPNIIVENMPGAGSLVSANYMYNQAPKDGTEMVTFIGGQITQKIVVENPAVQFDPMEFNWVGGPTPDTAACAVRKESGFTSLDQALNKEIILGGTAPGSTTNDIPSTLQAALGIKLKLVDGYGGTSKIRLAADQGEIHGGCWGWESISVTWKDAIEAGEVMILGQGGAKKHPDLKDVPHFLELAMTEDAKKLIDAGIVSPGQISRTYALPPGVPAERVKAMRIAFGAALKDSQLLADAEKSKIAIDHVPHTEFYERIQNLQGLSPELKAKLKAAVGS